MAGKSFLKLVALEGIEPLKTWETFCESPDALFKEFASRFAVDAGDLNTVSIIKSTNIPGPENRSKLWIKTSWPYGIGVAIGGVYQMDWGLSGYPANTPFLHAEITDIPGPELIKIPDSDLVSYGITNTVPGAEDRMFWYLFTPPEISF